MVPALNGRWVAWVVAINDLTIGALLLATMWIQRARPLVLAWAGAAWRLAVALIKLTSLEAHGGSTAITVNVVVAYWVSV